MVDDLVEELLRKIRGAAERMLGSRLSLKSGDENLEGTLRCVTVQYDVGRIHCEMVTSNATDPLVKLFLTIVI